jgi:hypothetical protein
VHQVFHWARGVPVWQVAQREACTERTIYNRIDRSMAPAPTRFGKVYIDGIGYMRDGRRLRDGREKADAKQLYETGLRGTEAAPDASYNKPCRA